MTKFITVHTPSVSYQRRTLYEFKEYDWDNCKEIVINVDEISCFNDEGIELKTGTKIRTLETIKYIKELTNVKENTNKD